MNIIYSIYAPINKKIGKAIVTIFQMLHSFGNHLIYFWLNL